MSADFFKKRFWAWICGLAVLCTLFGAGVWSWSVYRVQEIDTVKRFWFLVDTSTHVEAGALNAQYLGGAGYLLSDEESATVAFSVYLQEDSATAALQNLTQKNDHAATVVWQGGKLYLKSREDKRNAKKLRGAFESLYDNIQVLERSIAELENGGTQQSCKRILKELEKTFAYLSKEYRDIFSEYSDVCALAGRALRDMQADIVYARDLRYLQCELCVSYVRLTEKYAL